MDQFATFIERVCLRPALYVGTSSLRDVDIYLAGYGHALEDSGHQHPFAGWMRWIESRFLISHPAWHYTRILLHAYGTDRAALDAIPELHKEFVAVRASIGREGVEAQHRRRFLAEYGREWHEPEHTTTSPPLVTSATDEADTARANQDLS